MTKVKTVKANPVKKKLTAEEVNQLIDEALESFSEAMYEEFEEMQKLIDEMRDRLGFVE